MNPGLTFEERATLLKTSRPIRCKTGLGMSRGSNAKLVHHVNWMTAAYHEGRVLYFAGWECGDRSWDVAIVADPAPLGEMCKRCASIALGPCVYRCFNAEGQPIYIGSARCRYTRMLLHRKSSPWWGDVARVEFEDQPDIKTAQRAEAAAIEAECPLINKKHNRQRVRRVGTQWLEVPKAA